MNIKVNDKLEKIFEKRETEVNHTILNLMDHRIIELEAKLKEAEDKLKVEWHENVPEDQPDKTKEGWVYDDTYGIDFRFLKDIDTKFGKLCTHWAYANIPETPKQGGAE